MSELLFEAVKAGTKAQVDIALNSLGKDTVHRCVTTARRPIMLPPFLNLYLNEHLESCMLLAGGTHARSPRSTLRYVAQCMRQWCSNTLASLQRIN